MQRLTGNARPRFFARGAGATRTNCDATVNCKPTMQCNATRAVHDFLNIDSSISFAQELTRDARLRLLFDFYALPD